MPKQISCHWCNDSFLSVVRGGNEKKFCTSSCRAKFAVAARRYAIAMISNGMITVEDLKRVSASNTTQQQPQAPQVDGGGVLQTMPDQSQMQPSACNTNSKAPGVEGHFERGEGAVDLTVEALPKGNDLSPPTSVCEPRITGEEIHNIFEQLNEPSVSGSPQHISTCALHNGPALVPGSCDCGVDPSMTPEKYGSEFPSVDNTENLESSK